MLSQSMILARILILAAVVLVLALPSTVVSADKGDWPPSAPLPRLETGMHTARINRIGVDNRERFLITGSNDKTARVWDLASGELLQVLRVPSGQDPNEGKLYCAAISPDGSKVAVAGWTRPQSNDIYIFDRESGRLVHTVAGLPNVIYHLVFSPDGRYLAATLGWIEGLRVFRTGDWSLAAQDKDYGSDSYWADFDRRGRLVTSSWDGFLRLYDAKFQLVRKTEAPGGRHPFAIRFSPDGSLVAVGFEDSTQINVLSGESLKWRYSPDTRGVNNGDLIIVSWSRDGKLLYAGGRFLNKARNNVKPIIQWTQAGRGPATWREVTATDIILDIWPLQDGRLAYGSGDPAFEVLHPNGRRSPMRLPVIADFRERDKDLLLSPDGLVVQFRYGGIGENLLWQIRKARLDLIQRRLTPDPTGPPEELGLQPPNTAGTQEGDWRDTYYPRLDGRPLKVDQYESSRSLAVAPDGRRVVLGSEWTLYCFERGGRQLWKTTLPSVAWGVNVSGDGRFVVASLGDGSIRWYSLAEGRELLAFFLHRDGRWVMWCPEGFFDASPGGEKLMGYQLNQGPDGNPEFIGMDQVYDLFYRPDLVAWRLEGRPEAEIRTALSRFGTIGQVLERGLPPIVTLLHPGPVIQQHDRNFTVTVDLVDRGGGIGKVVYRLDGVTQETFLARPVDLPGSRGRISRPFTLNPGENKIEVIPHNADGTVAGDPITLTVVVQQPKIQPTLYGLAVGISKYRDHSLELKYAALDARDFAAELQARTGGLFQQVQVQTLLNEEATTAGIEQAFARLAQVIQPEDVFVLFMAGHGFTLDEDGRYYFAPQELRYINQEALKQGSLGQDKLQTLLESIKALKSLVILDTCNAGVFASLPTQKGVFASLPSRALVQKSAVDRLMQAIGRATLASSADRQLALEGYQGHGVFTHVLLEALRGRVEGRRVGSERHIYISDLARFVEEEVPKISLEIFRYEQVPMKKIYGSDFPIAVIKEAGGK